MRSEPKGPWLAPVFEWILRTLGRRTSSRLSSRFGSRGPGIRPTWGSVFVADDWRSLALSAKEVWLQFAMQPPTFGIHHLALLVTDLDAMERFYTNVLGLPLVRRWSSIDNSSQRAVWLALGHDAFLALERADSTSQQPPLRSKLEREDRHSPTSVRTPLTETPCCFALNAGWHLVALTINPDDREAWRRRLSDAGHPVERETDYTMYARDPEQNFIALSHWPGR